MKVLVHQIFRFCVVMLFAIFGTSMVLAGPLVASDITYFQTETTPVGQVDDVGFAARAPPLAMSNDLVSSGSSAGDAAWGTTLGKTMKQLGFTKVEVGSGNNPSFKFGF